MNIITWFGRCFALPEPGEAGTQWRKGPQTSTTSGDLVLRAMDAPRNTQERAHTSASGDGAGLHTLTPADFVTQLNRIQRLQTNLASPSLGRCPRKREVDVLAAEI